MPVGLAQGPDGRERCWWGVSTPDYMAYHDDEWGRPVTDERGIYEKLTLFGAGLVFWRHRTNIAALRSGTERRLNLRGVRS